MWEKRRIKISWPTRAMLWLMGCLSLNLGFVANSQTIPNAPGSLTASASWFNLINLGWSDNSTNEDGFKIERAPSSGGPWAQIAQVLSNTVTYPNAGSFPNTTYYYRVRAFNTSGNSAYTSVTNATTPSLCTGSIVGWGANSFGQATAPPMLTGVVAIASGYYGSLALRSDGTVVPWGSGSAGSPPAGLTGVVAIASGQCHGLALVGDGTLVGWGCLTPPAGVTGVVAIASGWFHSLALKSDGTVVGWGGSGFGETTPPTNLSGVVAVAGGQFWSMALKSDGTVVAWGGTVPSVYVPPASLSNVVAISAGAEQGLALKSDGTVVAWGGNDHGELNVPSGLSGVVAIGAGQSYSIALKSDSSVVEWGQDLAFGASTAPAGLNAVEAIADGDDQVLALTCAPAVPQPLVATNTGPDSIGLSWVDNSWNEDGFKLERALDSGGSPGTWGQIATLGANVTNYSDPGLILNTKYWYRVRSYNAAADSAYSNQAGLPTQPSAPINLTATSVYTNQINLSWTSLSPYADGFKIERALYSLIGWTFTQIAVVGSNVTSYGDAGLAGNSTYLYRVRSYNSAGDSVYSGQASGTIPLPPVAPSGLTATPMTSTRIDLVWTDSATNEVGFKVERAPDSGGAPGAWSQIGTAGVNVVTYSDTGLAPGTKYWYRVRVFNAGGDSGYSNPATATTVGQNAWINPASDKWEGATNWSLGVAPAISQYGVVITNGNTKVVTIDATTSGSFPGTMSVSNLTIFAPAGATNTLNLSNAGTATPLRIVNPMTLTSGGAIIVTNSTLGVDAVARGTNIWDGSVTLLSGFINTTNATTILGSTNGSNAQLVMTGGKLSVSNLFIAITNSTTGSFMMTGGELFGTNGSLWIGRAGMGQMTMLGGVASNRTMTVGGPSGAGTGTLTVSGGIFDSQLGTFIGYGTGSTGAVWITGGTVTLGSTTAIGVNGPGQLSISNGTVTMYYPTLCYSAAPGTLTFAGGNSTAYQLKIGGNYLGTGVVWMTGGNLTLTSYSNSVVDVGAGGYGLMTISNSTLTTLYLNVGYTSFGSLNIVGTGVASVWSNMMVGVNGSGNVWLNGGELLVPNGSITDGFYYGTGQITVSNGAVVAHDIIVGGATVAWVQGSLTMAGGSLTALADLIVGDCSTNSVGTVTLNAGSIYVTNAAHNAFIDVRNGTFVVNGGTLIADRLVMTNACGHFIHNGGTVAITTTQLDPTLDADGDGMPNGFEQSHGLDPLNPGDAALDSDGDGLSNLQEFLAGTNPTNSASGFRIIAVATQGSDVLITWQTGGGRTNVVQRTGGLPGGYFNVSSNIVISGAGDVVTNYLDKGAATNATTRFYRIALVTNTISDTNAPTLAITSPPDYSYTTNATITVAGTSADASGAAAVTVNGVTASSTNGYNNWTAIVGGLTVGTNTLVALAADNAAPANIATNIVHVIYAAGSFDGNGDGLPDLWQIQHFGSVYSPNAAPTADPDGDGMSNLQEFLTGTDPTDNASSFRITSVVASGSDVFVAWMTGPGRTNALQSSGGSGNGSYSTNTFADLFIVTNTIGSVTNYLDVGAATNSASRFYRVRLVP